MQSVAAHRHEAESQVESLTKQLAAARLDFSQAQAVAAKLKQTAESTAAELKALREHTSMLEGNKDSYEHTIQQLTRAADTFQTDKANLLDTIAKLKAEMKAQEKEATEVAAPRTRQAAAAEKTQDSLMAELKETKEQLCREQGLLMSTKATVTQLQAERAQNMQERKQLAVS